MFLDIFNSWILFCAYNNLEFGTFHNLYEFDSLY